MQSSLKKSLYLGLAAVSFVAVAGTTTNASAKSYAKAGSYSTLSTPSTSRNVNLTGTNAIYTKPGTVKGAKLVATTTTAKKLNASKNGSANFRAYGVKTTDRGSVYYKVVSFDKQYRGYVYGGKTNGTFAGGVASYDTTKAATKPAATTEFKLNAPAASATTNTTFFKAPAWTQYKIGRATVNGKVLTASSTYKDAKFTFNDAVTTSREGTLYYKIASVNGSTSDGLVGSWVKASDVTSTEVTPTEDNTITVNYINDANYASVGTKAFTTTNNSSRKGDTAKTTDLNASGVDFAQFAKSSVPAGYAVTSALQAKFDAAVAGAKYGDTVNVVVEQSTSSKLGLKVVELTNDLAQAQKDYTVNESLSKSDVTLTGSGAQLATALNSDGKKGQIDTLSLRQVAGGLQNLFESNADSQLVGTKTYRDSHNNQYHYVFTLENDFTDKFANDNRLANWGDNLTAGVKATAVEGAAPSASNNSVADLFN